jgi:hypothetical protein
VRYLNAGTCEAAVCVRPLEVCSHRSVSRQSTTAAAALLLAVTGAGCGGDESVPSRGDHESRGAGVRVTLPSGWRVAREAVSPKLFDPREILSVGTFPLRYRPSDCEAFAGGAQQDLGPSDAFLTIQEGGAPIESITSRPKRFRATDMARARAIDCPGTDARMYRLRFRDAGRSFLVYLGLGSSTPHVARTQALDILNSLRFDPSVKPDWPAST